MAGFEPTDEGVKVLCLTAWRHPTGGSIPRGEGAVKRAPREGHSFSPRRARSQLISRLSTISKLLILFPREGFLFPPGCVILPFEGKSLFFVRENRPARRLNIARSSPCEGTLFGTARRSLSKQASAAGQCIARTCACPRALSRGFFARRVRFAPRCRGTPFVQRFSRGQGAPGKIVFARLYGIARFCRTRYLNIARSRSYEGTRHAHLRFAALARSHLRFLSPNGPAPGRIALSEGTACSLRSRVFAAGDVPVFFTGLGVLWKNILFAGGGRSRGRLRSAG